MGGSLAVARGTVKNRLVVAAMKTVPVRQNCGVAVYSRRVILIAMSTVQEIEAVLPKLSRAELEEVRAWIDDFLEDQLELTDEVKARLDQSRREIAEG